MEDPVATPKLPAPASKDVQFSSSPGFGTPAFPIKPKPQPARPAFAPQTTTTSNQSAAVLPVLVPPQILRPVAVRTLKKHNLTLTSAGLGDLARFVGKFCGSGWREENLAEKVIDEVAKSWKKQGSGPLLEDGADKKLTGILKSLEPCMTGGRLDLGKLSRTNSFVGSVLSRQTSLDVRPEISRDDSQTSLGLSSLEVDDGSEAGDDVLDKCADARPYLKLINAFQQPRLTYSTAKKTLETVSSTASLLPPIQIKTNMFRSRYHLIHQRLLRNESFQTPSFATSRPSTLTRSGSSAPTMSQAYKITPISNLLGRSGTSHLLLGLLTLTATSDLALTDLSGSIVLDTSDAMCEPPDGAFYCPGMIVLVEGTYEEDGSNNVALTSSSGVGGQIKGKFVADTFTTPPAEKRDVTLGINSHLTSPDGAINANAGFGWLDFLGVGSAKNTAAQMRRVHKKLIGSRHSSDDDEPRRTKILFLSECNIDSPRILSAIRAIINSYVSTGDPADLPLSVVMMGNFISSASMSEAGGGGSVEYKENFDSLASMLSEFPGLLACTTFIFVPGDNDPWASSFSSGSASILPRQGIPELFTSRIRRAFATANNEQGRKAGEERGEAVWASNPARISLCGNLEEIVLFRDDISGRLRRNSIIIANSWNDGDEGQQQASTAQHDVASPTDEMELDVAMQAAASHRPEARNIANMSSGPDQTTAIARKLTKTILDQSNLSPFPLSMRPVAWDFASSLSLYPLPTVLVLADAEAPQFCITYERCHVINPGRILDERGMKRERGGVAKWIEYDARRGKGVGRDVRF